MTDHTETRDGSFESRAPKRIPDGSYYRPPPTAHRPQFCLTLWLLE